MGFVRLGADTLGGYVVDPLKLDQRFTVVLSADGTPVTALLANLYNADLAAAGIGDGHYGFLYVLPPALSDGSVRIEASLANSAVALPPLASRSAGGGARRALPRGSVDPCRHLTLTGWIDGADPLAPLVRVLLDGDEIAATRAHSWRHLPVDGQRGRAVRSFALRLPDWFADGRVRVVTVTDEAGAALVGSPVTIFAVSDGLEVTLGELAATPGQKLRLELFEEKFPASAPFDRYQTWCERLPASAPEPRMPTTAMAVVTVGAPASSTPVKKAGEAAAWSLKAIAGDPRFGFDPAKLKRIVGEAGGSRKVFVFMRSGATLRPGALDRIGAAFAAHPDAPGVYGDVEVTTSDGRASLAAWPAFDYERLLEQGYCAEIFALRRDAVISAIDADADSLFRLALAPFDAAGAASPPYAHIPAPLIRRPDILPRASEATLASATSAHLAGRHRGAAVAPGGAGALARVAVRRPVARRRVAVAIIASGPAEWTSAVVADVAAVCRAHDAMVVLPSGSDVADFAAIDGVRFGGRPRAGLHVAGRAATLNGAIRATDADAVLLLSSALTPCGDAWLDEMLSRLAGDGVAAVAPMIASSSGVVADAGCVLGGPDGVRSIGVEQLVGEVGYLAMLRTAREVSACSCDALLLDRARFETAGGFDEARFPNAFAAVDLCLALQEGGGRVVWTPDARFDLRPGAQTDLGASTGERAFDLLRCRWPEPLADDPYYSPLLSRERPFAALAAPSASIVSRYRSRPSRKSIPNFW